MEKPGFVDIVTNRRKETICVAVTSDPLGRAYQHCNGLLEGLRRKTVASIWLGYGVHDEIDDAPHRELQKKKSDRQREAARA